MTERDQRIFSIIDKHYPEEISFLPVISPFRFLVTVMLSASTTDRQAEKAAENLFSVYPDENAIAAADADDIDPVFLIRWKVSCHCLAWERKLPHAICTAS